MRELPVDMKSTTQIQVNEAINLALTTLTVPGDRVLVEHPTYPNAIDAVHARGARAVPVPLDLDPGPQGVWDLGPFPVRAYALCIIIGVIAAIWIGEKRWVARGGRSGQVSDLALWMVPFGLVGGRLYHVITDSQLYFGEGREPITALYVWRGGLGIWGAIALGAVGLYIGARRMGIKVPPVADAIAPGVLIGQAFGRFGNWLTRSSSDGPRTCRGGSRSTRRTGRPATSTRAPSTRRSSTRRSGARSRSS